ncbi:MAG: sulfite exporter TauE/SafE family protein [Deferribacterales bacterium]
MDLYTASVVFLSGVFAWMLSTLAGGGGGTVFIPVTGLFLPITAITPATSIAGSLSSVQRFFLYLKSINWELARLTVPFMILGSFSGAYLFSRLDHKSLSLLLAGFYLVNGVWSLFTKITFRVRKWHFPIAGFISAYLSGQIGVGGPFMNPFYINYGVRKEEMLGTKAVSLMAIQTTKVLTYAYFGVFTKEIALIGLTAGCGAFAGNLIGKKLLKKISDRLFRVLINLLLIVCAFIILKKYWF